MVFLAAVLGCTELSFAHHPAESIPNIAPTEGGFKNSVRVDYVIDEGDTIHVDGDERDNPFGLDFYSTTTRYIFQLSPVKNLGFSLIVPYVSRREKKLELEHGEEEHAEVAQEEEHADEHRDERSQGLGNDFVRDVIDPSQGGEIGTRDQRVDGLGDVALLGNWVFHSVSRPESSWQNSLTLGLKFPTGDTDQESGGERIESGEQPGSGSYDFLFGISSGVTYKRFSLLGSFLYRLNTEGDFDYEVGDSMSVDIVGKIRAFPASLLPPVHVHEDGSEHEHEYSPGPVLEFVFGLNGIFSEKDKEREEKVADTGGDQILFSPGIRFQPVPKLNLEATFQTPIYQDFNGAEFGPQVVTDTKWNFSVQVFF